MLHEFLDANRTELIERCRAKVALRPSPAVHSKAATHGIPLFLGQLIETLRLEQNPEMLAARISSGFSGSRKRHVPSEIARNAAKHGGELLRQGYTVDQVVHDYGDLCQAVTELAVEKNKQVSADEFRTLNGCLDDAIADAVTEFGSQRDLLIADRGDRAMSERLGFLAHELRNFLNTAMLSFAAIKGGNVGISGATSAVLDRSLIGLRDLVDRTLADVRLTAGVPSKLDYVAVSQFIADVQVAASLEAAAKGCTFTVAPVDPGLALHVDIPMLYSAVSNLLQNAFKFTRKNSHVTLKAYGTGDRVLIEVEDQCGGIPEGQIEIMFLPFQQHGADRSGLGLGLSISRRAVEACGGTLSVRNLPGVGCVFTVDLPLDSPRRGASAIPGPVKDLTPAA